MNHADLGRVLAAPQLAVGETRAAASAVAVVALFLRHRWARVAPCTATSNVERVAALVEHLAFKSHGWRFLADQHLDGWMDERMIGQSSQEERNERH